MLTIMYVWFNVLNMLCYDKCKTVEFRFLRPTFNFNKLYLWLYVFNGMLMFAEQFSNNTKTSDELAIIRKIKRSNINFNTIMNSVYPADIASKVLDGIEKLRIVVINQSTNKDYIGKDTFFEDQLFTDIF